MGSLEDALERCRSKLGKVGLTGRKLESVDLQEAGAITRQLVDELGLAYFDEIEQFVLSRIQAAGSIRRFVWDIFCVETALSG